MASTLQQIKASAGSGKTYTLTQKFLKLLSFTLHNTKSESSHSCKLIANKNAEYGWQEILAMTFTNKAAEEMRERLLSALKEIALTGKVKDEKQSGKWTKEEAQSAVESLLHDFNALNIRTIDSLINLIVRMSALDFSLSPEFEQCFNPNDINGDIYDSIAENAVNGDPECDNLFRKVAEQAVKLETLPGFLSGKNMRDDTLKIALLILEESNLPQNKHKKISQLSSSEEIKAGLARLLESIADTADSLLDSFENKKLNVKKTLQKAIATCSESRYDLNFHPTITNASFNYGSINEGMNSSSKNIDDDDLNSSYLTLCRKLKKIKIYKSALKLSPYIELAKAIISQIVPYEQKNSVLSSLQMAKMASVSTEGTYGVSELFCKMGTRIRHILIDEFQDTSREQWHAVHALAEEALSTGGSLTIVGDVKQSIYSWRGGDPRLFEEIPNLKSDLARICGKDRVTCSTLPFNWRSKANIVFWNNKFFEPLSARNYVESILKPFCHEEYKQLSEDSALLSQAFHDIKQLTDHCEQGGTVHVYKMSEGQKEDTINLLTDLVITLSKRKKWKEICILTRSNEQSQDAAKVLMSKQIPVVTEGSLRLSENPVIAELIYFLRFLNSPDDEEAFWNLLAGQHILPSFEDQSGKLMNKTKLFDWLASRRDRTGLSFAFSQDFPDAWEKIFKPICHDAGILTAYDIVKEILAYWEIQTRIPESEGFIQHFLEVLYKAEDKGYSDLSGFLSLWQSETAEEKVPLPDNLDAVKIMTMHKAKGLEFDTVILPWLNFSQQGNQHDFVLYDFGEFTAPAPLQKEMGRIYVEKKLGELREALHLIYVAMTRAKTELHCFFPYSKGPTGSYSDAIPRILDTLLVEMQDHHASSLRHFGDDIFFGDLPDEVTDKDTEEKTLETNTAESFEKIFPENSLKAANQPALGQKEENAISRISKEDWKPMSWLPKLKIYHSSPRDESNTAGIRGTFIHHCLEFLRISGTDSEKIQKDAERAVNLGLNSFLLPIEERETIIADALRSVSWFAQQENTKKWIDFGIPEQEITDGKGHIFRIDLLVQCNNEIIIVDYKTGAGENLPKMEYVNQVSQYMELVKQTTELPVKGFLVYLDSRKLIPVNNG